MMIGKDKLTNGLKGWGELPHVIMITRMQALMKIAVSGLAIACLVLLSTTVSAAAAQDSLVAEVNVSTVINFTIEDMGDAGLNFGSLYAGSSNNPEAAQNGTGAVRLSIGPETNVDCEVSVKADDFSSGSHTMSIGNAKWDIDNEVTGAIAMTNSYGVITTLSSGNSQAVWHWLSIPSTQAPGTYTTSFYYQAVAVIS